MLYSLVFFFYGHGIFFILLSCKNHKLPGNFPASNVVREQITTDHLIFRDQNTPVRHICFLNFSSTLVLVNFQFLLEVIQFMQCMFFSCVDSTLYSILFLISLPIFLTVLKNKSQNQYLYIFFIIHILNNSKINFGEAAQSQCLQTEQSGDLRRSTEKCFYKI